MRGHRLLYFEKCKNSTNFMNFSVLFNTYIYGPVVLSRLVYFVATL